MSEESLVFPLHFFNKINDFKKVLWSLKSELEGLIGQTRVMFAMKRRKSVGSVLMRNKQLSMSPQVSSGQRCNEVGCRQCPLVSRKQTLTINNQKIKIPMYLNCKSRNVVYLWVCNSCSEAYFGRTTQQCRDCSNGHRSCFTEAKWEKSALPMHCKDKHRDQFTLNNFSVAVIKKV